MTRTELEQTFITTDIGTITGEYIYDEKTDTYTITKDAQTWYKEEKARREAEKSNNSEERLSEVEQLKIQTEQNTANIEYIATIADIELL